MGRHARLPGAAESASKALYGILAAVTVAGGAAIGVGALMAGDGQPGTATAAQEVEGCTRAGLSLETCVATTGHGWTLPDATDAEFEGCNQAVLAVLDDTDSQGAFPAGVRRGWWVVGMDQCLRGELP